MSTFFLMCWEFFKTGLFSVGGGLATVPFLMEMGNKYGWFTPEEISTMIAVSESTPGPMGINMATYVGNHMFGVRGGVACTLSEVAPAIIVINIIAHFLEQFRDSKIVKGVFMGLRPAVVGLIVSAVIPIYLGSLFVLGQTGLAFFNWKGIILFAALLAFYLKRSKTHPVIIILIAAIVGIIFKF